MFSAFWCVMKQYFLILDGKKKGPFTKEEVCQLPLFETDLIWREGMENWVPVGELKELQDSMSSKTAAERELPVANKQPDSIYPAAPEKQRLPHKVSRRETKKDMSNSVIIMITLIAIMMILLYLFASLKKQ